MECSNCHFENPEGMRFCGGCGHPFATPCPACGFENPPGFNFCGSCGASLAEVPAQLQRRESDAAAERRQLTVLFCDLVGSTRLSEQLDPEELREVVQIYQRVAAEVTESFEGHIAQYLGDGVLVYLGYPKAHEDDARRAVHVGLGIVEKIEALNRRLVQERGFTLAVRVGIHTGNVVIGKIGGGSRHEHLAVGQAPNVAARLQDLAEPNAVVLSDVTHGLVRGFFKFGSLGPRRLKGMSRPIDVYEVLGESDFHSRFEVSTRGLSPLVGREDELQVLLRLFSESRKGRGRAVLVTGEAGIGKSRLVHRLKEQLDPEVGAWWICYGSPYAQNTAYAPLVGLVQKLLGIGREAPPLERVGELESALEPYGLPSAEAVPLLASLLSIPIAGRYPALGLTPQRQKEKLHEVLLALLFHDLENRPRVLQIEDMHWVDPSTLEFLELLMSRCAGARFFTLLTARPSFHPTWGPPSQLTELPLDRFSDQQVESLLVKLTGGKSLPEEVLRHLVEKADGVPLFIEEMTKTVLESGLLIEREDHFELAEPLRPLEIPTTLRDALSARLDRLGTAKGVAQLAGAVGRVFSYELLSALSPLEEEDLQRQLSRLVNAELILRLTASVSQASYAFKHALVQDAAYRSLLKSRRRQINERIARVLEERFPEVAESEPERLAHYFREARLVERAIVYLSLAGQRAIQRSAYVEAIRHFTGGLELLGRLPASQQRSERELELRSALGVALLTTRGYAAEDVEQNYDRARELCAELGDTPLPVLWGIWVFHIVRGDPEPKQEIARRIRQFLSDEDPTRVLVAHSALGIGAFLRGDLDRALEYVTASTELYKPERHHQDLARDYGNDLGLHGLFYISWCNVLMGYPDRAWANHQEVVALAERLESPFNIADAWMFAVTVAHECLEPQVVREMSERLVILCQDKGFAYHLSVGMCCCGWARVQLGEKEDGIRQIREGLEIFNATGAKLPYSVEVSYLIKALLATGQIDEGLAATAGALALSDDSLDRFYDAELHRLEGELLLASGEPQPAEACFREALEMARAQNARLLELRAATSFGRHLQRQERTGEARELLAEIYGRFTEGFDTRDLRQARELLQQLA